MAGSEVYERPPEPRVEWPWATVVVHFHHHDGTCVAYRQRVELVAGSGYSQAIDKLLNQDAGGYRLPDPECPRGDTCSEVHRVP